MCDKDFLVLNNFVFSLGKLSDSKIGAMLGEKNEWKKLTLGLFNAKSHCELVHVFDDWETSVLIESSSWSCCRTPIVTPPF